MAWRRPDLGMCEKGRLWNSPTQSWRLYKAAGGAKSMRQRCLPFPEYETAPTRRPITPGQKRWPSSCRSERRPGIGGATMRSGRGYRHLFHSMNYQPCAALALTQHSPTIARNEAPRQTKFPNIHPSCVGPPPTVWQHWGRTLGETCRRIYI